jgi:hypothetical protein
MIDGQIGNNANLTKLLFQLLQIIHHISIMRKQAEGSPVSTFLHKIAELDRFTRPARPHSDVIKRIQTLNRSWAKQVGVIVHNHYLTNLNSIISTLKNYSGFQGRDVQGPLYGAQLGSRQFWSEIAKFYRFGIRNDFEEFIARQEGEGTDTAFLCDVSRSVA